MPVVGFRNKCNFFEINATEDIRWRGGRTLRYKVKPMDVLDEVRVHLTD